MDKKSIIAYAEEKYRFYCELEMYEDARYWAAYLDGAKAQLREDRPKCTEVHIAQ